MALFSKDERSSPADFVKVAGLSGVQSMRCWFAFNSVFLMGFCLGRQLNSCPCFWALGWSVLKRKSPNLVCCCICLFEVWIFHTYSSIPKFASRLVLRLPQIIHVSIGKFSSLIHRADLDANALPFLYGTPRYKARAEIDSQIVTLSAVLLCQPSILFSKMASDFWDG